MKPIGTHNYFVYILTTRNNTVLYTGVTNDLKRRLKEHIADSLSEKKTFAGKYNCTCLVYYERHQWIQHAIEREKEIKGWRREKKVALIKDMNPEWRVLNEDVMEE